MEMQGPVSGRCEVGISIAGEMRCCLPARSLCSAFLHVDDYTRGKSGKSKRKVSPLHDFKTTGNDSESVQQPTLLS